MKKIRLAVSKIFRIDRFVEDYKAKSGFRSKLHIQALVSVAFFLLTLANAFAKSYTMLCLTASGFVINIIFCFLAWKFTNGWLCSLSTISTCSVLFAFFVIYGGNDGFACLWVILLPLMAMAAMDFVIGLCAGIFFQIYLIIVFWTPIRDMLFYRYNEQFCLRFPMFFLITLLLSFMLTVSLRRSEYNECIHLMELEQMAKIDPLTKLANRRFAYEEFESKYAQSGKPHCVVMGDIDNFKRINDTYGHEFGDEILVGFAKTIRKQLPEDYLKSRWGGEEFLFAANEPLSKVLERIENLRRTISEYQFNYNGTPVHITITFGIAEYMGGDGLDQAISDADRRLYNGKKAQKNCVIIEG